MTQQSISFKQNLKGYGASILTPYSYMKQPILISVCIGVIALCLSIASAQDWHEVSDGTFTVFTAAQADDEHLSEIFKILREAKLELRRTWGLAIPKDIQIYVHPNIESYSEATGLPWYVAAIANREDLRIDMQRAKVLLERRSLEKTLRHELFHLAQEDGLERWQAEGWAMIFAGEQPLVKALDGVSGEELNQMLEGFVDREGLARANATAFVWMQRELSTQVEPTEP